MHATLICDIRVLDPATGRDAYADIGFIHGVMAEPDAVRAVPHHTIKAHGLVAMPGLIDVHVHFREPGNTDAETVASGSLAAARGGFTTVVTMPNTCPPVDSADRIRHQLALAREAGTVRVLPSGCLTRGRQGLHAADLDGMAAAGAVAFTDDGSTLPDIDLMRTLMHKAARLGLPVMDHALDATLAGSGVLHEGHAATRLGVPGIPSHAESAIVERDIALCIETGCAVHIQHVSAAASVELIRKARQRGLPVSGEATPHHLTLCEDDIPDHNANYKMNPPLRTASDRTALLEAIADGTLQVLATDHAPHTEAAKSRGIQNAPFGVIGLETAMAVTYTSCVRSGCTDIMTWAQRWTTGPAAILGLPPPSLAPGQPANMTLLSLDTPVTFSNDSFASQSRNSPFTGHSFFGSVVMTFLQGRPTWSG